MARWSYEGVDPDGLLSTSNQLAPAVERPVLVTRPGAARGQRVSHSSLPGRSQVRFGMR